MMMVESMGDGGTTGNFVGRDQLDPAAVPLAPTERGG